ncbi:chloride channel core [Methanosalsum zhilinae DSM 4017]|uniref:Chloride channel core n=1 Tax=Methanosalsum zhilinae (strain DSM 4017 / NBRC 107636 / OCM 62 / WeN5) TaxID=679901 RepID=F7XNT6_METZD|nr:hypothetical protein [Methanosalsum zhilinae]AEH61291.1 chloride channel core [Methanosalsum zhilinae DSM 4017]
MKYISGLISILGFVLTLVISNLAGTIYGVDWLVVHFVYDVSSEGFIFGADISWIPIGLALLISYMGWKFAENKYSDE